MSKYIYTTKYKTVFDLGYLLPPLMTLCLFLVILKVLVVTNSINVDQFNFLLNWINIDHNYNSILGVLGFVTVVILLLSLMNYRVCLVNDCLEIQRLYWSKKKISINECTGFSMKDIFQKGSNRYEKGSSGSSKYLPEVYIMVTIHLKNGEKLILPRFQVQLFDDKRLPEVENFFKNLLPEISRKIEFLDNNNQGLHVDES